jgi:hypothetical protein
MELNNFNITSILRSKALIALLASILMFIELSPGLFNIIQIELVAELVEGSEKEGKESSEEKEIKKDKILQSALYSNTVYNKTQSWFLKSCKGKVSLQRPEPDTPPPEQV